MEQPHRRRTGRGSKRNCTKGQQLQGENTRRAGCAVYVLVLVLIARAERAVRWLNRIGELEVEVRMVRCMPVFLESTATRTTSCSACHKLFLLLAHVSSCELVCALHRHAHVVLLERRIQQRGLLQQTTERLHIHMLVIVCGGQHPQTDTRNEGEKAALNKRARRPAVRVCECVMVLTAWRLRAQQLAPYIVQTRVEQLSLPFITRSGRLGAGYGRPTDKQRATTRRQTNTGGE